MAVKIRLRRTGGKNDSCFRVVVADVRSQRDGEFIEQIGFYDPRHRSEKIDMERVRYWQGVGAQTSETVAQMIKRIESGKTLADVTTAPRLSKKAKAKAAKAQEESAQPAEA